VLEGRERGGAWMIQTRGCELEEMERVRR
jgi:hypothetical protein